MALSTVFDCVDEVVEALVVRVGEYIKLPANEEEMRAVAHGFSTYGYPNVYGAIDGTFINVVVPADHKTDYFTRKYTTSINLTCLCDSKKRILNLTAGFSARCHDSNIFKSSSLGRLILNENLIPRQYHIIGDAACGHSMNVMVPYPGANLSNEQERYNTVHSSTRMAVERLFADLKGRWLKLKGLECDLEFANKIIAACCVLHNISINNGDITSTVTPPGANQRGYTHLEFRDADSKRNAIKRLLN